MSIVGVGLQDNVVCLSPKLAQSLGNMSQICVCIRVTSTIHLIDPRTLQSKSGLLLSTDCSAGAIVVCFHKILEVWTLMLFNLSVQ